MANRAALSFSAFLLVGFSAAITQAQADGTDCTVYATDYANARMGSGDVVGDAVSGGMAGAVVGGEWRGASGAYRGARAGAALGVLDNMGSMPGGWQALYDMAYQMCQQQTSGVNAPYYQSPSVGTSSSDCRSSASVNAPLKRSPNGGIMVGSDFGNCR
ncbi:hypothetical protein ACP90_16735 [Labrenzia sp. CP4]|jgi:hypothetical protein|uniref:hypothetical protein n=1 Tax=Stappiaceae TaxID=2821832 RepID=UPI000780B2C4|nr:MULTISPECIES: hypothetical protein [Stappiaceae]MCR9285493.1 hypothetical protein [Paracoccaceae bacterium]MEC9469619.1 hypothetical protein [Pseudomonadota bacterium]AMN53798.1 hypothetical protein ACP90_16735 [Labrenzia sp. CP4]MEE2867694.1 hypothetical protein [Pseudomonadota bacterium]UES51405.1 hypothetical protein GFK88_18365 [Roseibium aggregatum]